MYTINSIHVWPIHFFIFTYRRYKQDGSEGDLSLSNKVCLGQWVLGLLREGLVELIVLLIIYLPHAGSKKERGRGEREEGEMKRGGRDGEKWRRNGGTERR